MKSLASQVINDRRTYPIDKNDLVNTIFHEKDPETGKTLPGNNIVNNMVTFRIAGNSTPEVS